MFFFVWAGAWVGSPQFISLLKQWDDLSQTSLGMVFQIASTVTKGYVVWCWDVLGPGILAAQFLAFFPICLSFPLKSPAVVAFEPCDLGLKSNGALSSRLGDLCTLF